MKTKILMLSILAISSITTGFAQDRTTVSAQNSEISDNLDLRAVASIFGDSRDLGDFERRLNDPKVQISNLDLNEDNQVDYLRVIESIEGNTHLVVIQSVLGRDTFQDVATVEVERDRYNRVQVQVVGDVFMYGNNYIYEPVYSFTPIIYASFWIGNYTPYFSSWYWGYYPSYYSFWTPYPIFRYQSNIGFCINNYHHYNYVNYRRCEVAYNSYRGRRSNAYENRYPTRSFNYRNENYSNRYELDNNRNSRIVGTRNQSAFTATRNYANNTISTRGNSNPRNVTQRVENSRSQNQNENSVRGNSNPRNITQRVENPRSETQRTVEPRGNNRYPESTRIASNRTSSPREFSNSRNETTRKSESQRENNNNKTNSQRNSSPREYSSQRENTGGNQGNSRGNKRS